MSVYHPVAWPLTPISTTHMCTSHGSLVAHSTISFQQEEIISVSCTQIDACFLTAVFCCVSDILTSF